MFSENITPKEDHRILKYMVGKLFDYNVLYTIRIMITFSAHIIITCHENEEIILIIDMYVSSFFVGCLGNSILLLIYIFIIIVIIIL